MSFVVVEKQTGVYIGSKIPQILKRAIHDAIMHGAYLNSSDFIRDAIKEKLQREHYLRFEQIPFSSILNSADSREQND
jgi:Arc/MetJ-type ribon-helix-helix transcriptional regulator